MCLDDQILNTYLDGELKEPWKSQVEEHLSYCKVCNKKYESLKKLSQIVKGAELTQEEIQSHQDRVLSMIEKNHINKHKKLSFFKKQFRVGIPQIMGVAAAFVIVFAGALNLGTSRAAKVIDMPQVNSTIDISNITPVRASDNNATTKTLENYSLEDILKNLDARGYDVDIRLKSIQPIQFNSDGTEVIEQQ